MTDGPASSRSRIVIASCVGGGPMERLASRLPDARVVAGFTADRWRSLMSAGPLQRALAKAQAMLLFPLRAVAAAYRSRLVVATTNPFLLPPVLVATRPLHGRAVVALVYDLYPDVVEAVGLGRRNGLLTAIGTALNRWWFRRADAVVFIGERMARRAIARYGKPRRWMVLETGADAAEFGGDPDAHERRVISYVGNLGHVHDWDTFAEGVPRWLAGDSSKEYEVVFAASGPGAAALRRHWHGHHRIRLEEPLDDAAWRALLEQTAIALVSLRNTAAHTSIPSKTFSAMAASSAIVAVAPIGSDVAAVVLEHDCGAVVAPGDVNGLAAELQRLTSDAAALGRAQRNARRAVEAHYDIGRLAERWRGLLDEVVEHRPRRPIYLRMKRWIDVVLSGLALMVLAPVLGLVALAIRITAGSPVLFRHPRAGQSGRPFALAKFRTMREPAPGEEGPEHDAVRLTRLGRLLRAASIDELPALWNVLRGEMSLVGPRPLPLRYLERYTPRQARRHEARPGITGWAQINGRNAIGWDDRFALDLEYVENASLLWDVEILLRTIWKVLRAEGISARDHATMAEFHGTAAPRKP